MTLPDLHNSTCRSELSLSFWTFSVILNEVKNLYNKDPSPEAQDDRVRLGMTGCIIPCCQLNAARHKYIIICVKSQLMITKHFETVFALNIIN